MEDRVFNICYEFCGEINEVEKVAIALHKALRGNDDYIQSHILVHYNNNYVSVTIWPEHCNEPIPKFLESNKAFIIFAKHAMAKTKKEKPNG